MFKVGEISKLLGLDRSFLHYYDEVGIIVPQKNEKNYRLYNENDLIALASSKYYRAMNMPLKSLTKVIQESTQENKIEIMKQTRDQLLKEAERMKDIAVISDYAIQIYQLAYQDDLIEVAPSSGFEFIPLIENGKYDEKKLSDGRVQKLLDFFPFVSYTYYFPVNALIDPTQFRYQLGVNIIPEYRKKYQYELPDEYIESKSGNCINVPITKNIENDSFRYEDFEVVRQYAKDHHLNLTGEAIAYCVFTNYETDDAKIKFLVQILTK